MPIQKTEIDKAPYIAYADKPGVIVDGSGGVSSLFYPFYLEFLAPNDNPLGFSIETISIGGYPFAFPYPPIKEGYVPLFYGEFNGGISTYKEYVAGYFSASTFYTVYVGQTGPGYEIASAKLYESGTNTEIADVTEYFSVDSDDSGAILFEIPRSAFPSGNPYSDSSTLYYIAVHLDAS